MAPLIEPSIDIPKKYTTMPPRGVYHSEKALYNLYQKMDAGLDSTDENLTLSQPLPNTVKIINEKSQFNKKDSVWLGCLIACFLCFAVKNEKD